MIERKTFGYAELKSDGGGEFTATFSRFSVIDHDLDLTLPGAFKSGIQVPIGAYNHGSVQGTALPVGIGTIHSDMQRAWVEAEFFDTPAGREHYSTMKRLGSLGEWSYGYKVLEASTDYAELRNYPGARRILKALDVIEVAPVIRGAGIDTRTDDIKGELLRLDPELAEFVRQNELVVMRDSAVAMRKRALVQRALRGLVTDAEFDEVLSWR